jgi:hypothetical protein
MQLKIEIFETNAFEKTAVLKKAAGSVKNLH